jgi:hypothetical protein
MVQIGPESAVQSWVMISRLPILTMLDRGFFDIRRNGCIDPFPARSNDLWTDLVIEPLTGNSNAKFDVRKFNRFRH